MGWWGAIGGGVVGGMILGPLGVLLGSIVGSYVTRNRSGSSLQMLGSTQERRQTAFFVATFSVMGHVAKADGHVSRDEIDYVKAVMNQLSLERDQRQAAIDLFNKGKEPDFELESVLDQFYIECRRSKNLLRAFIVLQIRAALVDGSVDPSESAALSFIAQRLHFTVGEFERLFEAERAAAGVSDVRSLENDYKILEIDANADDDEIRRAYRRLMSRFHPDKLVSKGLPDEMIEMATEKTKEIRAAYERIRDARKARVTH